MDKIFAMQVLRLRNVVAIAIGVGCLLASVKTALGQEGIEGAANLNRQVIKFYNEGRYKEAIPIAERALAMREKALWGASTRILVGER
jgi:hypothetical protein